MKVYKFGGASVKDAEGLKNLAKIVSKEPDNLIVVVSAFGKTTNALEKILETWIAGDEKFNFLMDEVFEYHLAVINDLFSVGSEVRKKIEISFAVLRNYLQTSNKNIYDYNYDQVVS